MVPCMKDKFIGETTNNVARFFSLHPLGLLRYSAGMGPMLDLRSSLTELKETASDGCFGIRSFLDGKPSGNPLFLHLNDEDKGVEIIESLQAKGYYTIVSESLDEKVTPLFSGVILGDRMELGFGTTPRCVDDPNIRTAVLPLKLGKSIINTVFGAELPLFKPRDRVEFTVTGTPVGALEQRHIVWEVSEEEATMTNTEIGIWPNHVSEAIGDKCYGLLVANAMGFNVPFTTAFVPNMQPFSFGRPKDTGTVYTRTCPATKSPGHYPSQRGYHNPLYALKHPESLDENFVQSQHVPPLASMIVQQEVVAAYAGVCIFNTDQPMRVEGTKGYGDNFMLGDSHDDMPAEVTTKVEAIGLSLLQNIGNGEIEWVMHQDGTLFVVQLCKHKNVVLPTPEDFVEFAYKGHSDLERFREFCHNHDNSKGIVVTGGASELSHVGQIAKQYQIKAIFKD